MRQALLERRRRLLLAVPCSVRRDQLLGFLQAEVWSRVPPDQLGRGPTKAEREEILGPGPEGL